MPYLVVPVGKLGNWLSGRGFERESRKKAVAEAKGMNEYFPSEVFIVTLVDDHGETLEWAPEKYYELRKQLKYRQNPMSDSMGSIVQKLRKNGYPAYIEIFVNKFGKKSEGIFLDGVRLNVEQIRILGGLPPKKWHRSNSMKNPTSRRKLASFHRASKSRRLVRGDSEIEKILKAQARELKRAGMGLSYDIGGTFAKKKRRKKNPMNEYEITLNLKRLPATDEWKVTVSQGGRFNEGASYYASDEEDAVNTAWTMRKNYVRLGTRVKFGKALERASVLWHLQGTRRRKNPSRSKGRKMPKRRRNFEMGSLPPAAFAKQWYKIDGAKRKISTVQAAALQKRGHKVEKATAPVKRKTTKKSAPRKRRSTRKGGVRKTARRAYVKKRKSAKPRKRSKAAITRERLLNLAKARRALGVKAKPRKRRSTRKGGVRKTASRAYTPARRKKRRITTKSGRKRSEAAIQRERLRNLAKARRARSKKLGVRYTLPSRSRTVRKAVRRVKRRRPSTRIGKIRRMVRSDFRQKKHRRGKRRVQRLASDAVFSLDFQRAVKRQRLGSHRLKGALGRLGRHPSHLDKRRTTGTTRRGWKEFAGTTPNMVARFKGSPVSGSFNGVLIDEIHGTLVHSGQKVVIKPPKNAPLYLIWTAGGRSFEVVGPTNAITSLAKGMGRAGQPIRLTKLNYLAPTYPSPAGVRRTGKEKMYVAYTHSIKYKAYMTWNQKSGSSARFPVIVRGAKGKSLVNRSGILL